MTDPQSLEVRRLRKSEAIAIGLFVILNLAIPAVFLELYPFTVAPMFSDRPAVYCNYAVYDPDGNALPIADFQLRRVYDGNPPGLGAGVRPADTLDRFGTVPDEETVRRHVARLLADRDDLQYVDIVQEVVGPVSDTSVGVVRTNRWRVFRRASR